jgi:hypothetical protein
MILAFAFVVLGGMILLLATLQRRIAAELAFGERVVAQKRAAIAARAASAREKELDALRKQIAELTESRRALFAHLLKIESGGLWRPNP